MRLWDELGETLRAERSHVTRQRIVSMVPERGGGLACGERRSLADAGQNPSTRPESHEAVPRGNPVVMSKRNVRFEKIYFLSLRPLLPTEIAVTARELITEVLGGLGLLLGWLALWFLIG
jgi:hypothetical protein